MVVLLPNRNRTHVARWKPIKLSKLTPAVTVIAAGNLPCTRERPEIGLRYRRPAERSLIVVFGAKASAGQLAISFGFCKSVGKAIASALF